MQNQTNATHSRNSECSFKPTKIFLEKINTNEYA